MRFWDRVSLYMDRGPGALSEPWGEVPAETFHRLVDELFHPRLVAEGFERPARQRWVRSRLPEVRELVEIVALRGASYSARWGLSLDFVPTLVDGKRWTWHRTVRSARMDLVCDPFDEHVDNRPWGVTRMEHERDLPIAVREWAERVMGGALAFFAPLDGLAAVEAAFAVAAARPFVRFGSESYRQHCLAHGFVLARLGRHEEALAQLGRSLARFPLDPAIEARVRAELAAPA